MEQHIVPPLKSVQPANTTRSRLDCRAAFSSLHSEHETTHILTHSQAPRTGQLRAGRGRSRDHRPPRLLPVTSISSSAAAASPSPSPGREAIYPRLTGKKLVFIDRLLTANLAISISVFVSLTVCVRTSGRRRGRPRVPRRTNNAAE